MKKISFLVSLSIFLFLSACATKNASYKDEYFQKILTSKKQWKIENYTSNQLTTILSYEKEQEFIIGFKGEQVFGKFGCNNFFGSYTIEGNKITIGNAGVTRKMCENDIMEIEAEMINGFLNTSSEITLKGKKINFSNASFSLEMQ
ncbi:META domain-containing protein [Helicobacter apodemus]|uniref:META domain-containing protein n=1 Tax=Helicobacter apodemus TaxID=135569 RepID=A0A4U8UIZ4_9HELI|nr:META domain-containing protein [Helicobacter apodemus]TLE17217.1 META domain-containing protein [Helicobacter apodemus]